MKLLLCVVVAAVAVAASAVAADDVAAVPVVHFNSTGGDQYMTVGAKQDFNVTFQGIPTTGYWWWMDVNKQPAMVSCPSTPTLVRDQPPNNFVFGCTTMGPLGDDMLVFNCRRSWEKQDPVHTASLRVHVHHDLDDDDFP